MRRRLIGGFLIFALIVTVILEVPLGLSLAANARTTAISELQDDGASLGLLVGAAVETGGTSEAQRLLGRFARSEDAIVLVVSSGRVELAGGVGAAEEAADPTTKAILASAADGRTAGEEGSRDPDDDLLYVALPVAEKPAGATRVQARGTAVRFAVVLLVAESAAPLHARIAGDWIKLAVFGAVVLVVAAAVGIVLARSLARPLAEIEAAVGAFGTGMLSERAPVGRGPAELRALGETVNEMAERLQELLQAQRAFVADASHQLRTPMTALRLRLENLQGAVERDDVADLAPAIAETDRLSRVVDGLLSLARADGTRPAREPVDVDAALRERAEAWSPLAEERHVTIFDLGDARRPGQTAGTMALACAGHLEQVLDNLIANALDATPEGGSVSLSSEQVGDDIEIHVVDTGRGMNAVDRARAFDRFWRPEGSIHEGTGLGLAIVAQLVRVSGGSAWLEAGTGGGVDAVVRLAGHDRLRTS